MKGVTGFRAVRAGTHPSTRHPSYREGVQSGAADQPGSAGRRPARMSAGQTRSPLSGGGLVEPRCPGRWASPCRAVVRYRAVTTHGAVTDREAVTTHGAVVGREAVDGPGVVVGRGVMAVHRAAAVRPRAVALSATVWCATVFSAAVRRWVPGGWWSVSWTVTVVSMVTRRCGSRGLGPGGDGSVAPSVGGLRMMFGRPLCSRSGSTGPVRCSSR
jgi:hypothetical protein